MCNKRGVLRRRDNPAAERIMSYEAADSLVLCTTLYKAVQLYTISCSFVPPDHHHPYSSVSSAVVLTTSPYPPLFT